MLDDRSKMHREKGFTLVELLVVMAIMSILATVSFGQFKNAQAKARDVERKSNLSAIYKSINFYFSDYNALPDEASLNLLLVSGGQFNDQIKGGNYVYLPQTPVEKVGSMPKFCYVMQGKSFAVFVGLENKADSDCKQYTVSHPNINTCTDTYNYALSSPDTSPAKLLNDYTYDVGGKTNSGIGTTKGGC